MPASPSSRVTRARRSGPPVESKPANACRNASRLRRIVSHDQPGLEALQTQLLEQAPVVGDREAPLGVVVEGVVGRRGAPPAAGEAVLAARKVHQAVAAARGSRTLSSAREQLGVELVGVGDDGAVVAVDLEDGRGERGGERALLGRRDGGVLGRQEDRARRVEAGDPGRRVVAAELAARLGEVDRVAAAELRGDPRRDRRIGEAAGPQPALPRRLGREAEHEPQRRHRAPERLHARGAPVERRGAEDEPGDELRVVAGEDRGDRAAHAVADRQHRLDLEVREQRGGVIGAGLERERLRGADAAAVAAVVDRQHAVAGLRRARRRSCTS